MWKELLQALNDLMKTYEALVKLGEKKRSALVAIDMHTLERLIAEEKTMTERIGALEVARQKALAELADRDRAITKDTKMDAVLARAPKEYQRALSALHAGLSKKAAEAKELGDNNTILMQEALKVVQIHLNRIGGTRVEPTYGAKGGEKVTHARNFQYDA